MSSIAGNIAPSDFLPIQPTTLVYPIILFASIIMFVYWLLKKSRYALIYAVIFIVSFGQIKRNFQFTITGSSEKKVEDTKLLSYNVKNFDEREIKPTITSTRNEIIDFLKEENSDIVCLQEYHSTNKKLYEPIKDIRDTLSMTSYYYESYYNPKYNQLLGLVTFSKYKAVNKGKLKFEGSRSFGIYTDLIINGDTIRVFNIHLASIKLLPSDLDFVTNPEAENTQQFRNQATDIYFKLTEAYSLREKQMDYLTKIIDSTKYKILLCGDFNDTPSSWVYKQISSYLRDTYVSKGNGISRTYAGPIPFLRIDYILTSNTFKTLSYKRIKKNMSDHYPITAIISSD